MARVTKAIAEEHKQKLVDAAGRLFRARGLDGVGVAEIAQSAGLTHGAIYSGFASKSELATAALEAGRELSRSRIAAALGPEPDLAAILNHYISKLQRDDLVNCCPMLASASEAARQDAAYRQAFSDIFIKLAAMVEAALERNTTREARAKALAITAGMIGVVAVARTLDPHASDELLGAARASFAELANT